MNGNGKQPLLPEQIKDLIGQLAVATAKSTAPENKLSLTSSRIAFDLAALQIKCREKIPPGLFQTLNDTLKQMISAMIFDPDNAEISKILEDLETVINERAVNRPKSPNMIEAMDLLTDYNLILECRERWKIANDTYMTNNNAWSKTNKMLADIHDVLARIELRYDLIVVPKNINWDINEFAFRRPVPGLDQGQQELRE